MNTLRKIFSWKKFKRKLKSNGFLKNNPIFQFLPSQAKMQCLGWSCYGNYAIFCAHRNSKYIGKLKKNENFANKFTFQQNR